MINNVQKNSQFIYINPAKTFKNPKTGEISDVRAQEIARLQSLKEQGFVIIGLEMTDPSLAAFCDRNIDPQHTDKKADQSCVKEIAENAPAHLGWFKSKDLDKIVFVTNRVDLDSVAAFVLAERYLKGEKISNNENVQAINAHDTHLGDAWSGPKPIEKAFDPESKTAALASSIKVFMVTPKNIEDVRTFVDTGKVEDSVMDSFRKSQQTIIDKVKSGEIKVEVESGVAYVETTLPCATNVGYSKAPVVVAVNPAMRLGQGEPFRKVSICQHETGYVDLNAVADKLNEKEAELKGWKLTLADIERINAAAGTKLSDEEVLRRAQNEVGGWGGSPTFKGSKQGESCQVSLYDIKQVLNANLTPEHRAKAICLNLNVREL